MGGIDDAGYAGVQAWLAAHDAGKVRVYLEELRELFKREKYIELLTAYAWMPDIERRRRQERPDQYVAVVKDRREVILAVIPTLMGGENRFVRPDGTIHVIAGLRAVSSYRGKLRLNREPAVMPSIILKQRPDEGHWRFEANGFYYRRSRELRGLELR